MSANLHQRLAVSALLVNCESLVASLSSRERAYLNLLMADVRAAFGPDIPERELPSNVVRIGDHDPEYIRALNAVAQEMGS